MKLLILILWVSCIVFTIVVGVFTIMNPEPSLILNLVTFIVLSIGFGFSYATERMRQR